MKLLMENWRKFINEQEQEQGTPSMEKLLGAAYPTFVQWLGTNIQDPKTQAIIGAGLEIYDGNADDDRFGFSAGPIPVAKLKPTQNEIDINKSLAYPLVKDPAQFIEKVSSNGPFTVVEPIVTFNGEYIIDGHHRWSTVYACNKNASIEAINLTLEGLEPLVALKAVQMAIGLDKGSIPVQKVEGTNLLDIDENSLKQWIMKNVSAKATNSMYKAGEDFINKLKAAGGTADALPSGTKSPHGEPAPEMNESVLSEISKNRFHKMMVTQILPAYVWSNVASMRKTSQPVPGAGPRDFMPQTGGVNWEEPLKKGQIDIKPPYGRPPAAKKTAE
tara:strand:- start:289 stop:1281 length:993 start_codon:yes stop_codon:yes gene_type:complete